MDYEIFETLKSEGKSLVFVWGDFNILHPGHVRLLNFAADCGDVLIVGIRSHAEKSVVISDDLRLQSLRAISVVQHAFVLDGSPEDFIRKVQPAVVVKGREHKDASNPEKAILDQYGGELIFSSGEARFSSIDLLRREAGQLSISTIHKPVEYIERHEIDLGRLQHTVRGFKDLKVVVVGDLIVDEYINCDPLGMSQEDPTIVVTPISRDRFLGAAGIVAAHAKGLGATVRYVSVCGDDEVAAFARERLAHYGVSSELIPDHSRPTTLKQRYRAKGKTLLRVSELRQHEISDDIATLIFDSIRAAIQETDMLIFSDFNYGCLPQSLVERIAALCNAHRVPMFADSQSSSQVGDITRFDGMTLVTPTEHEARLALGDSTSGLVVLAEKLTQKARCAHSLITLGAEGAFIHNPNAASHKIVTDVLPAMNKSPKDVAGAGDSMLTCTAMALVAGANIWEAAFLGSVAAACQVGRVGNRPLSAAEVIEELAA